MKVKTPGDTIITEEELHGFEVIEKELFDDFSSSLSLEPSVEYILKKRTILQPKKMKYNGNQNEINHGTDSRAKETGKIVRNSMEDSSQS